MKNKFGIPENKLNAVRERDRCCAYCQKEMISPYDVHNRKDSATIEHLNYDGPFYWSDGLMIEDIVIACGSCNSSRGVKILKDWFLSEYCIKNNICVDTVAPPVQKYLQSY